MDLTIGKECCTRRSESKPCYMVLGGNDNLSRPRRHRLIAYKGEPELSVSIGTETIYLSNLT